MFGFGGKSKAGKGGKAGKLGKSKKKPEPPPDDLDDEDFEDEEPPKKGLFSGLFGKKKPKKGKGAKGGKGAAAKRGKKYEPPEADFDDEDLDLEDEELLDEDLDFDDEDLPPMPASKGDAMLMYPAKLGFPKPDQVIKIGTSLGNILKIGGIAIIAMALMLEYMNGLKALNLDPNAILPLVGYLFGGVVAITLGQFFENVVKLFVMAALSVARAEKGIAQLNAGLKDGVKDVLEKMPVQEVAIDDFDQI